MSISSMPAQHNFAQVPTANISRSMFNRSRNYKTTFDSGYLVPFFVDEVLPGDTYNVRGSFFARLATPLKPVMDNVSFDTFYFFVPNRLLWTNWQKFCGEQINPGDSTSYVCPVVTNPGGGGFVVGTLPDYFGIPTGITGFNPVAFHFRAYNLIWNQWFRDENLQNSLTVPTGDGPDTASTFVLQRRGKRFDYFTSCLPFPQKGTAVTIPLGTTAPVITNGNNVTIAQTGTPANWQSLGYISAGTGFGPMAPSGSAYGTPPVNMAFGASSGLVADLSTAVSATINQLRQASAIQQVYERDARGGTRYTEILLSHFKVRSPDERLQRPEYLGGGSTPVNFNPIAQTTPTPVAGVTTPQGNLAAMATVKASGHGFVKSFVEHGIIIGLMSVRADLSYQQGLDRMWSRSTRFDYFWPDLATIGEQSVLNQEIYTQGTSADTQVFGYQERYAEYRYARSMITGQFRSTYSTPLDYWHLAQKFTSLPALNATFIADTPPIDRIIAVTAVGSQFLLDAYIDVKCARPMPVFGVPGLSRF